MKAPSLKLQPLGTPREQAMTTIIIVSLIHGNRREVDTQYTELDGLTTAELQAKADRLYQLLSATKPTAPVGKTPARTQ